MLRIRKKEKWIEDSRADTMTGGFYSYLEYIRACVPVCAWGGWTPKNGIILACSLLLAMYRAC